jgi:oxygen-dependent protoporphyrinogen oxidase
MTIVVVGAGLAGLAAVHELRRAGATVLLVDAERRPGGVIVSERPARGWVVEAGPDGFLGSDPDIPALAHEVGLADRIVTQQAHGSLVWDGGALQPVAAGAAANLLEIDVRDLDLSAGFRSFADGMSELVSALASGVELQRAGITALHGSRNGARLSASGGITLEGRGVVLAIPSYAAASVVAPLDATAHRALEAIQYHRSANVSLAYRREQIAHPLDASGFATLPAIPGLVRACTFASSKFPGRAPQGHVLLRAFVGPSPGDTAAAAHAALQPILGIEGSPLWTRAYEWPRGIPRYGPGHREEVASVRRRLAAAAPVVLAGAGYDGAGVSACVRSGRAAALELLGRL